MSSDGVSLCHIGVAGGLQEFCKSALGQSLVFDSWLYNRVWLRISQSAHDQGNRVDNRMRVEPPTIVANQYTDDHSLTCKRCD